MTCCFTPWGTVLTAAMLQRGCPRMRKSPILLPLFPSLPSRMAPLTQRGRGKERQELRTLLLVQRRRTPLPFQARREVALLQMLRQARFLLQQHRGPRKGLRSLLSRARHKLLNSMLLYGTSSCPSPPPQLWRWPLLIPFVLIGRSYWGVVGGALSMGSKRLQRACGQATGQLDEDTAVDLEVCPVLKVRLMGVLSVCVL
jgi:hypothetical protein